MTKELKDKIATTGGDLSALTTSERVEYYNHVCEKAGLDPLSCPFNFLKEGNVVKLYLNKGGANQLNKIHQVSHKILARETLNDCFVVTAQAFTPDGRITESIGAVALMFENFNWETTEQGRSYKKALGTFSRISGDAMANAMMKAETKSKRRSTIDLLGIGVLDESELESMAGAKVFTAEEMFANNAQQQEQQQTQPQQQTQAAPAAQQATQQQSQPQQQQPAPLQDDPFKKKYTDVKLVMDLIGKAQTVPQLAALWHVNADLMDEAAKKKFAERRAELSKAPAIV